MASLFIPSFLIHLSSSLSLPLFLPLPPSLSPSLPPSLSISLLFRSPTPDLLSEDMQRERERRRWEEEELEQAKQVGPVHYEDLKQGGQSLQSCGSVHGAAKKPLHFLFPSYSLLCQLCPSSLAFPTLLPLSSPLLPPSPSSCRGSYARCGLLCLLY